MRYRPLDFTRDLFAYFLCLILFSYASVCFAEIYVEPSQSMVNQTININAGSYTYYQLQLPVGVNFTAKFTVTQGGLDKKVEVLLLDSINFQQYASGNQYSFLKGTTGLIDGIGNYSVSIPFSGTWFLVVDNQRALLLPRTVNLYAYATGPAFSRNSIAPKQSLVRFYNWTQQQFTLPSFDVHMGHCGESNAFYSPSENQIKLCNELVEEVTSKGLNGAVPFILYHELGHAVLHLWDYPLSDNEDVADEFATVLTILSGQQNEAFAAANWWASGTEQKNQAEALYKIYTNDRHTISPQRARNIIGWLNNSDSLMRRWQKILVPKMQTQALHELDARNSIWVDRQFIASELSKREQSNTKN